MPNRRYSSLVPERIPGGGSTLHVRAATGRQLPDAQALVFEYLAATQHEAGRTVPANVDQLPGSMHLTNAERILDRVLRAVPIEDYTFEVAEHHAVLLAHVRRLGRTRGAHDLIIAATAVPEARTPLTTDFTGLAGLNSELVRAD